MPRKKKTFIPTLTDEQIIEKCEDWLYNYYRNQWDEKSEEIVKSLNPKFGRYRYNEFEFTGDYVADNWLSDFKIWRLFFGNDDNGDLYFDFLDKLVSGMENKNDGYVDTIDFVPVEKIIHTQYTVTDLEEIYAIVKSGKWDDDFGDYPDVLYLPNLDRYLLGNGNHRVTIFRLLGLEEIKCYIYKNDGAVKIFEAMMS